MSKDTAVYHNRGLVTAVYTLHYDWTCNYR